MAEVWTGGDVCANVEIGETSASSSKDKVCEMTYGSSLAGHPVTPVKVSGKSIVHSVGEKGKALTKKDLQAIAASLCERENDLLYYVISSISEQQHV